MRDQFDIDAQVIETAPVRKVSPQVIEAHIRNARKLRSETIRAMFGALGRSVAGLFRRPAAKPNGAVKTA